MLSYHHIRDKVKDDDDCLSPLKTNLIYQTKQTNPFFDHIQKHELKIFFAMMSIDIDLAVDTPGKHRREACCIYKNLLKIGSSYLAGTHNV